MKIENVRAAKAHVNRPIRDLPKSKKAEHLLMLRRFVLFPKIRNYESIRHSARCRGSSA